MFRKCSILLSLFSWLLLAPLFAEHEFWVEFMSQTASSIDLTDPEYKYHDFSTNLAWVGTTTPNNGRTAYNDSMGYYDDTMIGVFGALGVSGTTTVTFSGDFQFTSQTDHSKYKKYKIAVNGRRSTSGSGANKNDTTMTSDAAKYGNSSSSFYVTTNPGQSYSFVMQPSDRTASDRANDRWADFIIILEGTDEDLAEYHDYRSDLHITMTTTDPSVSPQTQSFDMTLWGYVGGEKPDKGSNFSFFVNATDAAKQLDIASLTASAANNGVKIADIQATNYTVYRSKPAATSLTPYKLYISAQPNTITNTESVFKLRKVGTTYENAYNSIPFTITYKGNAAASSTTFASYADYASTQVTHVFKGDNADYLVVPCAVTDKSNNGYFALYRLEGDLDFSFEDIDDANSLTAGWYSSSIYLNLVAD